MNSAMEKTVYLSLGSNLGDREAHIREAIDKLSSVGTVTAVSSIYETEPVEFTAQPWFLNCAVELHTEKMPRQLLSGLLSIERQMGRQRTRPKGPRIVDIDILLFGDSRLQSAELTIPHPAMHERRFVLEPLAEIAPSAVHPVFKSDVRKLLESLPQGSPIVRKFTATHRASRDHRAPKLP